MPSAPTLWPPLIRSQTPRPCLHYEAEKYPPPAFGRFAVKPGITGLWQVSGRSNLAYPERTDLEL